MLEVDIFHNIRVFHRTPIGHREPRITVGLYSLGSIIYNLHGPDMSIPNIR